VPEPVTAEQIMDAWEKFLRYNPTGWPYWENPVLRLPIQQPLSPFLFLDFRKSQQVSSPSFPVAEIFAETYWMDGQEIVEFVGRCGDVEVVVGTRERRRR
jgi:hypothetical protein